MKIFVGLKKNWFYPKILGVANCQDTTFTATNTKKDFLSRSESCHAI